MPLIEVNTATGAVRSPSTRRSRSRSRSHSRSRSRSRSFTTAPHRHARHRSSILGQPPSFRHRSGRRPRPPSTRPPPVSSSVPRSRRSPRPPPPQFHRRRPHPSPSPSPRPQTQSYSFRPTRSSPASHQHFEHHHPNDHHYNHYHHSSSASANAPPFSTPMSPLARLSLASLLCARPPSTHVTPTKTSTPTMSVAVPLADLRGAVGNGLRKRSASWMHRFLKRRVRVEASVDGVKDFVFYAPEGDPSNRHATPTEFVKIRPTPGDATIVRRSDAFEITFVGMSVIPEDTIFDNTNELLLYSLKTCHDTVGSNDGVRVAAAARQRRNSNNNNEEEEEGDSVSDDLHSELTDVVDPSIAAPTSGFSLSPDDIPFIHYDPVVDRHDVGTAPNSFVPVPASKALFYQHRGECMTQKPVNGLASVPLRFNVLEIDHVSDEQARAVGSKGELGKMVKSTGIPYLQPLSMAVSAASALGKEGLKNYSKPDHVMSKDLVFMLAEPEDDDSTSTSGSSTSGGSTRVETYGNFLRYGYYFFLGQKVDAKLYAQTGSSSQTVPLLLRRQPFTKEMRVRDEKEFFPLTGVSYVCIKVSAGCSRKYDRNVKMMEREHRSRLENMLQMSDAIQMLSNVQKP